jgi:hypothetical protein
MASDADAMNVLSPFDLRRTGRSVAIAHAAGVESSVAVDNAGAIGAGRIVAETNAAIIKFDARHLIRLDWFCVVKQSNTEKCQKRSRTRKNRLDQFRPTYRNLEQKQPRPTRRRATAELTNSFL